jgi:branched-chain amino acid aminotransferase
MADSSEETTLRLEKPELAWFNGRVVPWHEARVHVWSELAIRGTNVFEGLRAYWNEREERYYLLSLDPHLRRLYQSGRLLRFPPHLSVEVFRRAIFDLLTALDLREHAYVRPTIYIEEGRYGFEPGEIDMGAYVVAFPTPRPAQTLRGARCCVSSWRRSGELVFSPRIKAGAAYQAFRLPLIEAHERGFDDAILLNADDKVAEASGAAVFIIRDGTIITPPVTAGILESISRRNVIELLRAEHGKTVVEREIDRTELYIADEIFMCGTLCEIQPVIAVDGYTIGDGTPGPLTTVYRDRYFQICESGAEAPYGWLTPVGEELP